LRKLRAEIVEALRERPRLLSRCFDRYVEAVLAHSGYRLEVARAELESGLERVTEPLVSAGLLDEKTREEMFGILEQSSGTARTVAELVAACRKLVAEIGNALERPTRARHQRGTGRAIAFMRDHFAEAINIQQVARVSGFAPDYFSRLFKVTEGVAPEAYLQRLRLEHAQRTLTTTSLSVDSIGKLCGFRTRNYFHKVFKRALGITPTAYRKGGVD
jgi:AraC-like DNA-binding protein